MLVVISSTLLGAVAGAVVAMVMMRVYLNKLEKIDRYYRNRLVNVVVKTVNSRIGQTERR